MSPTRTPGLRAATRVLSLAITAIVALGVIPAGASASSTSFIPLGGQVGAALFDPTGSRVYALGGASGGVMVVDRATHAILGEVAVPGAGTAAAIDPATGDVLVGTALSRIEVVDPDALSLRSPIALPLADTVVYQFAVSASGRVVALVQHAEPNHQPPTIHLLAFDIDGGGTSVDRRLSSADQPNELVVDDAAGRVYGAGRTGVIAYDLTTLTTLATVPTAGGSVDLAFDPAGQRLYSIAAVAQPVTIVDTSTLGVVGTLPGEGDGWGIAVDATRNRVFVERTGRMQVFEGGVESEAIPFRGQPRSVSVDPVTGDAWLNSTFGGSGLWVVDMAPTATPRSGFLTAVGGDLELDGTPYTFTGVNLYNANSDGWCREAIDDATLDASLDSIGLSWSGHGVIRAWFFQTLATDYPSGARDWSRFDRLVHMAAIRGYKVIPTLADQWGECGTRDDPTYSFKTEAWYTGGYTAPDPALAAAHGGAWLSYRDWVAEVVTRYKDDPTIAFWQLMNEAEVNPGGAFGVCPPGDAPRDELIAFATDVSALVKSIDPDHLLSLGTIGGGQCGTSGPQYKDVHAIPDIDLCEYHDYTPNQAIPGDQFNGLGLRVKQCAELGKPLFVGETGIRPIDVGGRLEDREVALTAKIFAQFAHGIDGVVAWNFWPGGSTLDNYDIGPGDPAIRALEPFNAFDIPVVNAVGDANDGTCNASHCSLREAINRSNDSGGTRPHVIDFAIPGPGPHVIKPTSPLPAFILPTILDGTSQTDYAGSPTVVISGVDGPVTNGLVFSAPDSAVRGLVVNGFGLANISLQSPSSMVTSSRIGTDATGTVAVRHPGGRADVGIRIANDGMQIGGVTGGDPNLIAGNDDGIVVGGQDSRIMGNLIGTDPSGNPGAGNAGSGVRINAALRITVGGTNPGERNVIAGSGADGIAVVDDVSDGNVISGNSIHDNGGLGIDLGDDGVDPTPPANVNPATGPNRYQARPAIDDVTNDVATGRVWGQAGPMHIEFFVSPTCDASGNGEGSQLVGTKEVTAAGTPPSAAFTFPLPAPLATASLTATVTTSSGTSEFSPCWPPPAGPGDTPVGTDVPAAPVDETTGESPVQVVFDNVTASGVTSLVTGATAPPLPAGFVVGDPPTYFDLSTTAVFDGAVKVCISFAGIAYIDPADLRLYHYQGNPGAWVDATTSVDTGAEVICGSVTSLSPFALVQPAPSFTSVAATTFTAGANGSFTVRTNGFLHPTLSASGDVPGGIVLDDHHDGTAVLRGVGAPGSGGIHAIMLTGREAGVEATQSFSLTIREAPSFTSPATAPFTLGVGGTFQVTTRGYPAPALSRTGTLPSGLSFNTSTGVLSGTPASGTTGTFTVTVRAANGVGAVAQQALTVAVGKRAVNVAAACAPDPSVPGTAVTCTATITDGSAGTRSTPSAAASWSVVGSGKLKGASCATQGQSRICTVTVTTAASQTTDPVVRASYPGDASHVAATADVPVRLIVVNADTYAVARNGVLTVGAPGVLANDANVGGLPASVLGGAPHGVVVVNANGSFTYTPTRGYRGKDGFTYRVKVGADWSQVALVTINVGP